MDEDRKYRQNGYMDSNREFNGRARENRPKPNGPRPSIDITGPRLPRLVESTTAARCFNCTTPIPSGMDLTGQCPKCGTALHCCKQCAHFEPSTRFQCLKPIPERIPVKDAPNTCELFKPRVTVARDAPSASPAHSAAAVSTPRSASDARAAFDNLFKK